MGERGEMKSAFSKGNKTPLRKSRRWQTYTSVVKSETGESVEFANRLPVSLKAVDQVQVRHSGGQLTVEGVREAGKDIVVQQEMSTTSRKGGRKDGSIKVKGRAGKFDQARQDGPQERHKLVTQSIGIQCERVQLGKGGKCFGNWLHRNTLTPIEGSEQFDGTQVGRQVGDERGHLGPVGMLPKNDC